MSATNLCPKCNSFIQPTSPQPSVQQPCPDYVPSDVEAARIRSIIEDEEAILAQYDTEIMRFRAILTGLEADRLVVETRIRERRAMISTLRRLPTEIVESILSFAQGEYSVLVQGSSKATPTVHAAVHAMSQVSRSWRRIALSRPCLWSSISVDLVGIKGEHAALVRTHIRNSGQNLLSINISERTRPRPNLAPGLPYARTILGDDGIRVFQLLMKEMYRCRSLMVMASWKIFTEDVASCPDFSFSALQIMVLYIPVHGAQPGALSPTRWFWRALHNAPNVREAGMFWIMPPQLSAIPYDRLTSLDIREVPEMRHLLDLLQITKNLVILIVHKLGPRQGALFPVVSTSLRSLKVSTAQPYAKISPLFDFLTIPMLEEFALESSYDYTETDCHPLTSLMTMLGHCALSLQRLHLLFGCPYEHTLSEILQCVPCVTHFTFSLNPPVEKKSNITPCLLHLISKFKLASPMSTPSFVLAPKLKRLDLVWPLSHTAIDDGTTDSFVEMVQSRSRSQLVQSGGISDVSPLVVAQLEYSIPSSLGNVPDLLSASSARRIQLLARDGTLCYVGPR